MGDRSAQHVDDGRTAVWIRDALVASATSSPVKPPSKRRLPGSNSSRAVHGGSGDGGDGNGINGAYSPGRSRANGKSLKKSSKSAGGWGWTRACIVSQTSGGGGSDVACKKPYGSPSASGTLSTGQTVLLIADPDSEHDGCTITIDQKLAQEGMVMANTFTASSSPRSADEYNAYGGGGGGGGERLDFSSPTSGSDKENTTLGRSSAIGPQRNGYGPGLSVSNSVGSGGPHGGGGSKAARSSNFSSPRGQHRSNNRGGVGKLGQSPSRTHGRGGDDGDGSIPLNGGAGVPPDDLITLTHLHEPAVVHCLKLRYQQNSIYTSTGPILLALNPFKDCARDLYGESKMRLYWERGEALANGNNPNGRPHKNTVSSVRIGLSPTPRKPAEAGGEGLRSDQPLPPHVYRVADDAFRSMMRNLEDSAAGIGPTTPKAEGRPADMVSGDQSILVSGESGAGKTVTTKIIMQYLAMLSKRSVAAAVNRHVCLKLERHSGGPLPPPPRPNDDDISLGSSAMALKRGRGDRSPSPPPSPTGTENIENQVLESNPILESFGNARTIRNDNSSRFGKFIEIQFTMIGSLVGAHIDTYLLEKVRLISQTPGERNYHIFYEILHGASPELKADLFVDGATPEDFRMTSQSGTYTRRDGVSDDSTFRDLIHAMETMGFNKQERHCSFVTAAALLHASNLTFVEITADEGRLDMSNPFLHAATELFGVTPDDLDRALCFCAMNISAAGESLTKKLSVERASKALEALIKATYGALFTFLVQRINSLIACKNSDRYRGGKAAFIGVLDIFGFESFDVNSFEQLCINYCNEALQQQFNRFVFKLEQQEYEREGIEWSFISFPDNQDVLDLIDARRTGIIPILDDLCLMSRNTDEAFAVALQKKCCGHSRFDVSRKQRAQGLFSIQHYAGTVEYTTRDFLEKNKDELPREATELLLGSSNDFIQLLGYILSKPKGAEKRSSSTGDIGGGAASDGDESGSQPRKWGSQTRSKKSSLVRTSVGSQFSSQLRSLRTRIDATSPHYIRCLKPNDDLVPDQFDPCVIVDQLRCGGILEAVRVSRVGFPHRYQHQHFVDRYYILGANELGPSVRRMGTQNGLVECQTLVHAIARQIEAVNRGEDPNVEGGGRAGSVKSTRVDLMKLGIQVGNTKVFLRRPAFEVMERMRNQKKSLAATLIASVVRMFLVRTTLFRIFPMLVEEQQLQQAGVDSPHRRATLERELSDYQVTFEASLAIAMGHTVNPTNEPDRSKSFKWVFEDGRWVKNMQFSTEG